MRRATLSSPLLLVLSSHLSLALVGGCDSTPDSAPPHERASEPDAAPPSARVTPRSPELPSPPGDPSEPGDDWRAWVDTELARATAEAPEWTARVLALVPTQARSGVLRLVDPALEHPAAAALLLHRLTAATEPAEHRPALAAALARTKGPYLAPLVELLAGEADPEVRAALVRCLRRNEGPQVIEALALALADTDPRVRQAAASEVGRATQGAALADPLAQLLTDADAEVRLSTARSLGYLGATAAMPGLTAALASDDARLRLAALQALDRIDPSYARGLAQLDALAADPDAKVAAAAQRIQSR